MAFKTKDEGVDDSFGLEKKYGRSKMEVEADWCTR